MKNRTYNFICIVLSVSIFLNICYSFKIIAAEAESNSYNKVIVIDPGHGGEDGGALASDGTLEKDINLKISLTLKDLFEQNGFTVIMTRNDDSDLCDKSILTVAGRKKSDIIKRTEICNNSGADLVLSIHQNYFEQSEYSGAQMFYGKNEKSKLLAEYIQYEIKNKLQPANNREIKKIEGIYLLDNVNIPIIIAECGFISNSDDLRNLMDDEYIKALSLVIYMGANEYLNAR